MKIKSQKFFTENIFRLISISGKKFPQKSSHNLICEARFAGEALGTDEVPLDSQPDISQELAWEVDKSVSIFKIIQ